MKIPTYYRKPELSILDSLGDGARPTAPSPAPPKTIPPVSVVVHGLDVVAEMAAERGMTPEEFITTYGLHDEISDERRTVLNTSYPGVCPSQVPVIQKWDRATTRRVLCGSDVVLEDAADDEDDPDAPTFEDMD